jgi:hypothetical protein
MYSKIYAAILRPTEFYRICFYHRGESTHNYCFCKFLSLRIFLFIHRALQLAFMCKRNIFFFVLNVKLSRYTHCSWNIGIYIANTRSFIVFSITLLLFRRWVNSDNECHLVCYLSNTEQIMDTVPYRKDPYIDPISVMLTIWPVHKFVAQYIFT